MIKKFIYPLHPATISTKAGLTRDFTILPEPIEGSPTDGFPGERLTTEPFSRREIAADHQKKLIWIERRWGRPAYQRRSHSG